MDHVFYKNIAALLLVGAMCVMGFADAKDVNPPPLRLATTTSTENSGLLAALMPVFEKKYGAPGTRYFRWHGASAETRRAR